MHHEILLTRREAEAATVTMSFIERHDRIVNYLMIHTCLDDKSMRLTRGPFNDPFVDTPIALLILSLSNGYND